MITGKGCVIIYLPTVNDNSKYVISRLASPFVVNGDAVDSGHVTGHNQVLHCRLPPVYRILKQKTICSLLI